MKKPSFRLPLFVLMGVGLFLGGYYQGTKQNQDSVIERALNQEIEDGTEDAIGTEASTTPSSPRPSQSVELEDDKRIPKNVENLRELLYRAQSQSNPILRYASFAKALENLNDNNLEEVLETFETMPFGFEHMQEYRMLLYAWAQFDPINAIEYCNRRASGMGAGFATAGVLEGWASRDPLQAKAWVERPENAGLDKIYNFGLVRGWASRDLNAASDYVFSLEGGKEVEKLVGILTEEVNKQGFATATNWAESLTEEQFKESAFSSLSKRHSRDNPKKMARWLEAHAEENYAIQAMDNLGKRWSETDPEAAINYFADLPPGKGQEMGIKSVVGNWAKEDPLAAGEWLNEREAGPELDSALSVYASAVSRKDGAAAMEWAISISDEKLQESTIRKVGQEWYRQDKDSVETWLPESGLSQGMQKVIRNPPKKNWWQSISER